MPGVPLPPRPRTDLGRKLLEFVLQVREELHGRLALERVTFLAARAEREALRFDGDGGLLHVLADVPAAKDDARKRACLSARSAGGGSGAPDIRTHLMYDDLPAE